MYSLIEDWDGLSDWLRRGVSTGTESGVLDTYSIEMYRFLWNGYTNSIPRTLFRYQDLIGPLGFP